VWIDQKNEKSGKQEIVQQNLLPSRMFYFSMDLIEYRVSGQ
jgi:hypothetical protein